MQSDSHDVIHVNPAFTDDEILSSPKTENEDKTLGSNTIDNESYIPDDIVKSTTDIEKDFTNEFDEYREIEFPNNDNSNNESADTPPAGNEAVLPEYNMKYGWLCISPPFFKYLNTPFFFLICLCFSGIAQGLVVTGISFTVLTSIEKQFGLKSSEVAVFATSYDIAYGICSVLVGYVGHYHKPRCIGAGVILMTIGTVILAIPKFIIGQYEAGIERSSDFCFHNSTIPGEEGIFIKFIQNEPSMLGHEICTGAKEWYYQFIFCIGNVLLGIGAIPLYTLAPAHIDEVTGRGRSSIYMGIYFACCAIGPALGFIIGMPVLNAWVDLKQPENSSLIPTDPNWVGAWWLGYLIGAGLLLLPLLPMLAFPREFPSTAALRIKKLALPDTKRENNYLNHDLKSLWPATKALLKNKPFILIGLSYACECLAIGGYSTFLSKFVQTQFYFSASNSALYTGCIVIPGAAGGILLGGYLVKRYKWNCKQTLRSATIMAFFATLCTAIALVGCKGRDIVGQTVHSGGAVTYNFTNACNLNCRCTDESYKPICTVADQKTYYSPCHAGCSKENSNDKKFYNCSCFAPGVTFAENGRCKEECTIFPLSVVGAFFLMLFTFMNNVPMLNATLRVVNEGQGSFAMGFQQIFIRFLGFIPAPLLFGSLIDKSCNLWQRDPCTGESTSCLEYDQAYFRYYMFALGVATKFASFLLLFLAYKLYKLPPLPKHMEQPTITDGGQTIHKEIVEDNNVVYAMH